MKLAALLLATILLAACAANRTTPPGQTSPDYVDNDPHWPDGQPK
jgi:outer membrane biogenesis lipoprotein LolB